MKKRIVIADDHVSIRQMLRAVLRRESAYEIVGEAGTGIETLSVCASTCPDVLVLDLILPRLSGVDVMRRLRQERSAPRMLVYSGTLSQKQAVAALRCRPDGFVEKGETLSALLDALRVVAAGGSYFTPFATRMMSGLEAEHDPLAGLTQREREILQMVAEGRSSKEIAVALEIATKTVENHRQHLMEKLHVHSIAGLTRYAVDAGFVAME
jgi:two-component system response regulator NreC